MTLEILTPDGFKTPSKLIKLESIPCVRLLLSNGNSLECSEDHLIFTSDGNTIFAKDSLGQTIIHLLDYDVKVIEITSIGLQDCYDVSIDGERYFTNNILSHNSTISSIYLLHYILFNQNKTVAILANKNAIAKEILGRIKLAYMNLPKYLQQGILEWNRQSIELENGSKIIAAASSSSNIRGMSISCVDIESSHITLRNNHSGSIYHNTIIEFIKDHYVYNNNENIIFRNYDYEILTQDSFKSFNGLYISEFQKTLKISYYIPFLNKEDFLICTPDHKIKFYKTQKFIRAEELLEEDLIATMINQSPAKVLKIEKNLNKHKVVDFLNVEKLNSFICNNIVISNCLFLDECISGDSQVTIRDPKNNDVTQYTIEELTDIIHK